MILKVFDFDLMQGILSTEPEPAAGKCSCKCKLNLDYKAGYNDGAKDNN